MKAIDAKSDELVFKSRFAVEAGEYFEVSALLDVDTSLAGGLVGVHVSEDLRNVGVDHLFAVVGCCLAIDKR